MTCIQPRCRACNGTGREPRPCTEVNKSELGPCPSCLGDGAARRYVCPHCGADDSGRCTMLPQTPTGHTPPRHDEPARKVGCRVMYYRDLAERWAA